MRSWCLTGDAAWGRSWLYGSSHLIQQLCRIPRRLDGSLQLDIRSVLPLEQIVTAHRHIETGMPGRVILDVHAT